MSARRADSTFQIIKASVRFAAAILVVCNTTSAQAPAAAVVVAGAPVSEAAVKNAVHQCGQNAPELSAPQCLDRYWISRWLLDAEARERKLMETRGLVEERKSILSSRLLEILAEDAQEPSEEEINSYLKKHARDFQKPLRIRIFRVLVSTEDKAAELLRKLGPTTSLTDFRKLARDHSLDRATNERGGDLGFVWPDGSTDVPQVSADPALYKAALELQDGEFSTAPIAEGKHFAILWRRGSLPAQELDVSSKSIARLRLLEADAHTRADRLLGKLSESVVGRDDELLGKLRRPEASLFREH